jgi:hypothetical protein
VGDSTRMDTHHRSSTSSHCRPSGGRFKDAHTTIPATKRRGRARRPLPEPIKQKTVPSPFTPEPQQDQRSLVENRIAGEAKRGNWPVEFF